MQVWVQLYGLLRQNFPDFQSSPGLEVEMTTGATVKDLLPLLNIPASLAAVVIRNGHILKPDERINPGDHLSLIQAIQGG